MWIAVHGGHAVIHGGCLAGGSAPLLADPNSLRCREHVLASLLERLLRLVAESPLGAFHELRPGLRSLAVAALPT